MDHVLVDLSEATENEDGDVVVPIVSSRYDDPHEADAEKKKRQNSMYSSSGRLEMVGVEPPAISDGDNHDVRD